MLRAVEVKSLVPQKKMYKKYDEKGLYLEVHPNGAKYWRLKYYSGDGRAKYLALGVYPEVSLKSARESRDEARALVRTGVDPGEERKRRKVQQLSFERDSFSAVAKLWIEKKGKNWGHSHLSRNRRIITKDLGVLARRPVALITAPELLEVLRRIEARGALETAKRARQISSLIFRFAIAEGKLERDVARDLEGALEAPRRTHRAAITDVTLVGPLLRDLWGYEGTEHMRTALKLAPLLFVRPGELRCMEWLEIDFDDALWTIPADKMKSKRDHLVPLAKQSIELLRNLEPFTGNFQWVFPSGRSPRRPMSDNGVLSALRRLEIPKEVMSGHGFRAMARTLLDEQLGQPPEWIEVQLAHLVKDSMGQAYNRSVYLEQRRKMMQLWANYLDGLREPKVIALKRKQGYV